MRKFNLVLILILFFSCKETIVESNNLDKDTLKAESLSASFYQKLQKKEYDLIIKSLEIKEDSSHFRKMFKLKDSILGNFISVKYENFSSRRIESIDSLNVGYFIDSTVKYEKGITTDDVQFLNINDSIYLVYYGFTIKDFK